MSCCNEAGRTLQQSTDFFQAMRLPGLPSREIAMHGKQGETTPRPGDARPTSFAVILSGFSRFLFFFSDRALRSR